MWMVRFILTILLFVRVAHSENVTRKPLLEYPELELGRRAKRSDEIVLEKGEYCAAFRINYDYFCRGIWDEEKLVAHSRHMTRIKKFCPTYKRHCVHKSTARRRYHRKHYRRHHDSLEDEVKSMSYEEILDELAKIIPCTPECNPNIHPHCTQECKCDYDYPRMQRFCNPPALPLFLNVCRLWYNQCPKYEQYHYASQFIYSKAEKGKTTENVTRTDEQRRVLFDRLKRMRSPTEEISVSPNRRAHDAPITDEDRAKLIEIAEAVERFKRDPFSDVEASPPAKEKLSAAKEELSPLKEVSTAAPSDSHSDSDLREKEGADSDDQNREEGFIAENHASRQKLKEKEGHSEGSEKEVDEAHSPRQTAEETDELPTVRGNVEKYCDQYEQHFSFYCVGDIDRAGHDEETISKFCPSYKRACPHKKIASTVSLTAWPSNPFTKKVVFRAPVDAENANEGDDEEEEEEEELTSAEEEEEQRAAYLKELKRRYPCKPDCDKRIFPHCTEDCKCDYLYPTVQRFCNPPPMPMFLNTCRLWYNGCAKYAQYHYASQYIYSKAEKGKKLPGATTNNPNPYNIPSPAGVAPIGPARISAALPTQEQIYADNPRSLRPIVRSSNTLVLPPPLPKSSSRKRARQSRRSWRYSKHRRNRQNSDGNSRRSGRHDVSASELYRSLSAINSLTSDPVKVVRDPASILSGSQGSSVDAGKKPRAHQANTFPVVPSDAIYGTNDNTFKQFDGLTDSSGILHRPRSRSPFTKPGLWEPNPDDPHNRDHANKYFYAPRSVAVDWLNGQLAWGAHWAVPAAGVGGTDGYSTVHFPTIGTFLNIPDDYD
ncbi:hypothetical protein Q1695_016112 [Nippostrongylus brasiliensis]|nr:hypothetical protein Q1695_016112 [Nippostrongylus brasiliensis]